MSDGIDPGFIVVPYRDVPLQDDASVARHGTVVVFETEGYGTEVPAAPLPAAERSDSLQFVRDVAARVREAQNRSDVAVSDAREAARRAIVAMWKAEERALEAEARLAAAVAKAEYAEEQLRLLKSERGGDEPVAIGVDRWLNEAYLQLRLTTGKRHDDTSG